MIVTCWRLDELGRAVLSGVGLTAARPLSKELFGGEMSG